MSRARSAVRQQREASHLRSSLCQYVTPQIQGKDKYGQVLADVLLADGTIVNHAVVKAGWCWWYRKHAPKHATLETLEKEAIVAERGLWADPEPVPPWEFQRQRK